MISKGPVITSSDKEFTMRRLNIVDIFRLAKIIAKATDYAGIRIAEIFKKRIGKRAVRTSDFEESTEETEELQGGQDSNSFLIGLHMLATLPHCEKEIIAFLADLIGKTPKEFEELPPDILLDIIEAIDEHEDLKAFFSKAAKLMNRFQKPNPTLPE